VAVTTVEMVLVLGPVVKKRVDETNTNALRVEKLTVPEVTN